MDESIQVLSNSNDCDSDFHMTYNVCELHEYDDDIQYNERWWTPENDELEYSPTVKDNNDS